MKELIKARLLLADLKEIDKHYEETGFSTMTSIVMFKQVLIATANLVDFEQKIKPLYAKHRHLSASYRDTAREFEFAKYLRNKFVGHIKPELIEKAVEWRPELNYLLKRDDALSMYFMNLFVLETAINTYVNVDGTHKVFDSNIHLIYTPDLDRFVVFLTGIVKAGTAYLQKLIATLSKDIQFPDENKMDLKLWVAAGRTEFKFIRK